MSQPDVVRAHFAGFEFGPPCSEAEIQRAEEALSEELPPVLRELYLAFNGFLGPTKAAFFWPLLAPRPLYGALVEMNRFLRSGEPFPQDLVSQCLFFGGNGIGPSWGIKKDLPGKMIQWDARWGPDFEIAGESPLEVWLVEKRFYEETAS